MQQTLPIYERLELDKTDRKAIIEVLENSNIGKAPTYIILPQLSKAQTLNAVINLNSAFNYLKINPKFPYPVYVIAKQKVSGQNFPILMSEKELPRFFGKDKMRISSKQETMMANKNTILYQKIKNIDIESRVEQIRSIRQQNKTLSRFVEENQYLAKLIEIEKYGESNQ